jgi:hypothetical protein
MAFIADWLQKPNHYEGLSGSESTLLEVRLLAVTLIGESRHSLNSLVFLHSLLALLITLLHQAPVAGFVPTECSEH